MKVLLTTLLLQFGCSLALAGDNLSIGVSKQGDPSTQKPQSGMSMAKVREKYGSPNREEPAVGEPPITRWHYESFTVYFEHDKVIHSVLAYKK